MQYIRVGIHFVLVILLICYFNVQSKTPDVDQSLVRVKSEVRSFSQSNPIPNTILRALHQINNLSLSDEAVLKNALLDWLSKDPIKACNFAFRELPVDLTLKFIPELMASLANFDDFTINECLKQIRTKTELTQCWQLVVKSRMLLSGENPLALALMAPPGASIASTYLSLTMKDITANSLHNLLQKGLPLDWLLPKGKSNLLGSDFSSEILFQGIDKYLGGTWTKDALIRFMGATVGAKDAEVAFDEMFKKSGFQKIRIKDLGSYLRSSVEQGPESAGNFVNALPEGFLKSSVRGLLQSLALDSHNLNSERSRAFRDALGVPESSLMRVSAMLAEFDSSVATAVVQGTDASKALNAVVASPDFESDPSVANSIVLTLNQLAGSKRAVEIMMQTVPQLSQEKRILFETAIVNNLPKGDDNMALFLKTLDKSQQEFLAALPRNL